MNEPFRQLAFTPLNTGLQLDGCRAENIGFYTKCLLVNSVKITRFALLVKLCMDLEDQNLGKKRRSGYKPNEIQHGCCGQRHFPGGKASRPIVPRDTPCNIHGR